MTEILLNNIYLTILLPLWIFLIIMVGRFFSVYVNKHIVQILTILSSFFGALLCGVTLWQLPNGMIYEYGFPFIKINDFIINYGIFVDKMSLVFTLTLFIISFLIQIFSVSYMQNERKLYRFFALMNLFNFAMASLFFSPNLFQTYFFWEFAGVASYLLIGFEYFKTNKSLASKKVFIINRIGDTALLGAILLSSYFIYSYAGNIHLSTLPFVDMNIISTLIYAYTSTPFFLILCGLFIFGILVKSAQFPFYNWLQEAMEAKLPVSALLHSATLLACGLFLALRLMPLFILEMVLLKVVSIVGLLTALICSLSACVQTNPKKVLAYSTSAQFGLMFFALGILNIKAVLAYFIAHAFIKSLLFITLPRENESWSYIKCLIFIISGLSLSGLMFSGMIAKEMMIVSASPKIIAIFSILAFLTAFYIIRIALRIYSQNSIEKKSENYMETFAITSLLLLNVAFYFYLRKHSQYSISESFWAALTAWICTYILYIRSAFIKIPLIYPLCLNGFYLDKLYMTVGVSFYEKVCNFASFVDKNIFTNYRPIFSILKLGVNLANKIEQNIMNKSVNYIQKGFKHISIIDKKAQTGNIQKYNAYAFIIITVILTCLILAYTAIISYIGG